jgi:electron transfer flavoprotein beta subunit
MKLVCCVKQVALVADEPELAADGCDIDLDSVELALNEADAVAVEEALRIAQRLGGEVVVVTYGATPAEEALRRCLAMGADRAIRVQGSRCHDPIEIAGALAEVVRPERPGLVLCGAQSSDSANSATGTALAHFLSMPRVTGVTRIDYDDDDRNATVHREVEDGLLEVIEVDTPAVLTIRTGTSRPRQPNLRAIKQAERAEIDVREADDNRSGAARVRRMHRPPERDGPQLLTGPPAQIAARIAEIVHERLR